MKQEPRRQGALLQGRLWNPSFPAWRTGLHSVLRLSPNFWPGCPGAACFSCAHHRTQRWALACAACQTWSTEGDFSAGEAGRQTECPGRLKIGWHQGQAKRFKWALAGAVSLRSVFSVQEAQREHEQEKAWHGEAAFLLGENVQT